MSRCATPTPFETLAALWSGDLPPEGAASVEEHVFACDHCSAASDRLAWLVGGLREMIPPILSPAHRDRLLERGMRLRVTPCEADGTATAHFAPEVDLLVHVLRGDLSRAEQVDVEIVSDDVVRVALEHVPFDRKSGEVMIACQRHYEHMFPGNPIFRVHTVEAGVRRRVGDYLVHHIWR